MNDTAIQLATPTSSDGSARGPRPMPVAFSFLTAWIAPRWTARRTLTVSLKKAWIVHALAGLSVFAIIFFAVVIDENGYRLAGMSERISLIWTNYEWHLRNNSVDRILEIIAPVLGIEGLFFALGCLLMPWGARDEPMKRSLAHSLRQIWLRTSHFIPIALVISSVALWVLSSESRWLAVHTVPSVPPHPSYPSVLENDPKFKKAMEDYESEVRKWREIEKPIREERQKILATQPWYLEHQELIIIPTVLLNVLWIIWGLFRAVATPRSVARIERSPTCEFCGYDLTTMPLDSRCPECGQLVMDSLGQQRRRGPQWEHRKQIGKMRAWLQSWTSAIRSPQDFGLNLRACEYRNDFRNFVVLHLPFVFLIAAMSAPTLFWIKVVQSGSPRQSARVGIEFFAVSATVFGTACTLAALAVMLGAASKAALEFIFRDKRNLLAVSVQASAYLMPYLVLWELFGAVSGIWCVWLVDTPWAMNLFHTRGINRGFVCFMIWFIPNVTLGIYHMVLVRRITRAARWANK